MKIRVDKRFFSKESVIKIIVKGMEILKVGENVFWCLKWIIGCVIKVVDL